MGREREQGRDGAGTGTGTGRARAGTAAYGGPTALALRARGVAGGLETGPCPGPGRSCPGRGQPRDPRSARPLRPARRKVVPRPVPAVAEPNAPRGSLCPPRSGGEDVTCPAAPFQTPLGSVCAADRGVPWAAVGPLSRRWVTSPPGSLAVTPMGTSPWCLKSKEMKPTPLGTLVEQVLGCAGKHRSPLRELPVRCISDRDDADPHRRGPGPSRARLWSRHASTPRLCTATPVGCIKGPRDTSIPFVLIPGEGGAEA